jgi:kynureninase
MHLHSPRTAPPPAPEAIAGAVRALGDGPLTDEGLVRHIHPLFSRVMARPEIYLANHSLGRPLDLTGDHITRFAALWAAEMDGAWGPWMEEINAFRARVASLLGLSRADAVVPRPGAGQGLRSVLNALPQPKDGVRHHIVTSRAEFDSIDFILKTYESVGRIRVTWVPTRDDLVDQDELLRAIDPGVDLVVASHVVFATGQLLDRADEIVHRAHAAGALCVLDMYHSAGVVPIDLEAIGADFAIGGSYKYFRGGPGAGWLAIHPRHLSPDQPALRTLDTGWFAKRDTFSFQRSQSPLLAPYGDAWMECTPAVLTAYQANPGLALLLAIGVDRLRAYSMVQQSHLGAALAMRGVPVRFVNPRGAFLLMPSADAPALAEAIARAGVNSDARGGHVRLCPDILNTTEQLDRAASIIARVSGRSDSAGSRG